MKALIVLLMSASLAASPVHLKTYRGFDMLKSGELDGTALTNRGEIVMSHALKSMADLNETYLWDFCDNGNTLYIAAGEKGKIYTYTPGKGEPKLLAHFEEGTVYSLAFFRGKLYAGLSPDGKIYEIDPASGKMTEKLTIKSKYIWRMVVDNDNLYVATGLPGNVLRVDRNFLVKTLGQDLDKHVESLLVTDSRIIAGTYPSGYVIEIRPDRKPFLLTDTPFKEVKDLVERDGTLYAACFNGKPQEKTPPKVKPAKEIKEPPIMRGGIVTIDKRNIPEVLFTFSTVAPFSLLQTGDDILVGTGHSGKILLIKKDRMFSMVGEVDCGQVMRMMKMSGRTVLITSNPGEIFTIEPSFALSGTYTAKPFDAGQPVNWGKFYFDSITPVGSRVTFQVRAGNSASPDATWSDWQTISGGQSPDLPSTTRIQWRAKLISQDPAVSATVTSVRHYFREVNLPPRLDAVTVLPPGVWVSKKPMAKSSGYVPDAATSWLASHTPPDDTRTGFMTGMQAVAVGASDPNNDSLRFNYTLITSTGQQIELKKDSRLPWYTLNTNRVPEGNYRISVTVSDAPENYPQSYTDTLTSDWFLIDRTPPVIAITGTGGGSVTFKVQDDSSIVEHVEVSGDGGATWQTIWPEDGIADSQSEIYKADTSKFESTALIRAVDDHGNQTTALATGGAKR